MDRRKKVIEAAEIALVELDKVIKQKINLVELEPEKAKIAAQAKWVAIEDSFKIIEKIEELSLDKKTENKVKFLGVEDRIK
tara:strand:+ start:1538 stop:1780 length:243 start_codon:yes stop_codon:yes gene_type:complete